MEFALLLVLLILVFTLTKGTKGVIINKNAHKGRIPPDEK